MADSNKTIRIDIIIDDKGTVKVKQLTDAVKALSKENKAAKDTQVSLIQQIQKLQGASKRTADVIKSEISLRKKLISSTATTNKEYLKGSLQVTKLENELRRLNKTQDQSIIGNASMRKSLGNVKSATGSASGAVVELGRTISDSNYGFPAMANNVQQLATQMTFVVAEQGGVVKGFKAIGKAMTGVGGVLLLFTIGVALLEKFSLESRKVKNESESMSDAIGKAGLNLKLFRDAIQSGDLSGEQLSKTIANVNSEYEDLNIVLDENGRITKESRKQIDSKIISLEKLAKANVLAAKAEEIYSEMIDLQLERDEDLINIKKEKNHEIVKERGLSRDGATFAKKLEDVDMAEIDRKQEEKLQNREERFQRDKKLLDDRLEAVKKTLIDEELFSSTFDGGDESTIKDQADKLSSFMQKIREKAEEQKLGGDEQALLGLERDRALAEARALGAEEEGQEIQEIQRYYGDLAFELYNEQNDRFKEKREADAEERLNAELKGHRQRLKLEKQAIKAKEKVQMTAVKFANVIANLMAGIDEKSKTLKVLSFILEKGSAIASVLIQSNSSIAQQTATTQAANAAVRLKYAGVPGGAIPMQAEIKANNLAMTKGIGQTKTSSALSIASILATSLKSSGGSTPSGGATSTTGGGETATTQPPDFNIVGQSATNQLAQTIALSEEQPLRAYVVAEDVTTAQQLDNSIIQSASLG